VRNVLAGLRLALVAALLAIAVPAAAHSMPMSEVSLSIQRTTIDAELTLPIAELALGWDRPLPLDAARTVRDWGAALKDYVLAHVHPVAPDGRPWSVAAGAVTPVADATPDVRVSLTLTPPPGAPVDRLTLRYDVIFDRLVTHSAVVRLSDDWDRGRVGDPPILLGVLRDTNASLAIDRGGGRWSRGFAAAFRLGAHHIAAGTDHLLFLLALLLPAPLLADRARRRWGHPLGTRATLRRILAVVTAFTLGHSLSLAVGVAGGVHWPDRWVESAIALSVLASAVHALVPLVGEGEAYLAGGFGLVHGLAFAAALARLRFDPLTLASSVLAFNLGIETFQVAVVLVALPALLVLSRTPRYAPFRVTCACLTGVAAAAWALERARGGS
jgi:hypothetical protein